jgi:hypothetical protein
MDRRAIKAGRRARALGTSCALVAGVGGAVWAAAGCSGGDSFIGAGSVAIESPASGGDDASCTYCAPVDLADSGLITAPPLPGGARPTFGPTTVASKPPPAISGGTLLVTHDGTRAVAADPDRDVVYVVDLAKMAVTATIALKAGDEPGRLVEDGDGRVHVALRAGGALVTIDPARGAILERRSACPAPRGVAYDAAADAVWVACATGEIVSLPAGGGAATQSLVVERDLRDLVVSGGALTVSQFRSAQLLGLDATGNVARRANLPSPSGSFSPHVAWRTVAGPSGTFVSVHQAETIQSLTTHAVGGYGGGCGNATLGGGAVIFGASEAGASEAEAGDTGGTFAECALGTNAADAGTSSDADPGSDAGVRSSSPGPVPVQNAPPPPPPPPGFPGGSPCGPESGAVMSVLTVLAADGHALVNQSFPGVLPVDVAVSSDGSTIAAVAPGNAFTAGLSTVFMFTRCGAGVVGGGPQTPGTDGTGLQAIAVAFDAANEIVVQTREPAGLSVIDAATGAVTHSVALSKVTRADTGHDVFHTQAGGMIACGSCHPEGGDDGHVWLLDGAQRRTPSLRGTIAGTAPYHWPGDEADLDVLVNDVYTVRMSGVTLTNPVMGALTTWVQKVPELPAPSWVDPAAASRGQALFERADVGCATCHSGPKFTNNVTVDVGTGGSFQVPPLVGVGWRTPLFHDGCARVIADRFGACATPKHGSIETLSSQDVSDLIAYLETL